MKHTEMLLLELSFMHKSTLLVSRQSDSCLQTLVLLTRQTTHNSMDYDYTFSALTIQTKKKKTLISSSTKCKRKFKAFNDSIIIL